MDKDAQEWARLDKVEDWYEGIRKIVGVKLLDKIIDRVLGQLAEYDMSEDEKIMIAHVEAVRVHSQGGFK